MSLFQDNPEKVGVIGLGIIGSRVANCLREAGWNTYVWNRTPKTEPNSLGSPAEVAAQAKGLQLFVRDGDSLFEVVDQLAPALTAEHVVGAVVLLGAGLSAATVAFGSEYSAGKGNKNNRQGHLNSGSLKNSKKGLFVNSDLWPEERLELSH